MPPVKDSATQNNVGISLARQLLLWVLLPQLVLWLAGGIASYQLASRYAERAIDSSLLQASRSLARQLKPIGSGLLIDFPRAAQDILEADPSDRYYYMVSSPPGKFILGNQLLPSPSVFGEPNINAPYSEDIHLQRNASAKNSSAESEPMRMVSLYLHIGEKDDNPQSLLVQVARSSANRQELAQRILVDMLLPLSSLMLLMTLIVWLGIRAGLAPLARLLQQVEGRAPMDLAPLQLSSAPKELWSLVRALNTLLQTVRDNVAQQKRFIGDAAHQLRTPLAGLKSQTEIAMETTQDPELRKRLGRVHESAVRSAHVVTQLLTLARAEPESTLTHDLQDVNLTALAQDVTAALVPRALKAHIDLGMEADANAQALHIQGNALLLREALMNVIDNALHYAGAQAQVTVRTFCHPETLGLEVEDDGPGIDTNQLDRVFERFVRATDIGSGCGLGLPIVKEIIERHGGQVHLLAVQPHGLKVRMLWPLNKLQKEPAL